MSTGLLSCASPLSPGDGAPQMPLLPPGSSPSPVATAPPGFPPGFGWFLLQSLASRDRNQKDLVQFLWAVGFGNALSILS